MKSKDAPRFIFLAGETASGKSAWALAAAKEFGMGIINCDSIQCYHGFRIGASQPTAEDFRRRPHYLYDFVKHPEELTVGSYQRHFYQFIDQLKNEPAEMTLGESAHLERPPKNFIVVGGTGFYFMALEKGLLEVPASEPIAQKQLEELAGTASGLADLYSELTQVDPETASKISAQDAYRIVRALLIMKATGKRLSDIKREKLKAAPDFPYAMTKIGIHINKEALCQRVESRVEAMFEQGFVQEVMDLLKINPPDWRPFQSVGYKEVLGYIEGHDSLDATRKKIVTSTLQLAKKQRTWFKRDKEMRWLGYQDLDGFLLGVESFLNE